MGTRDGINGGPALAVRYSEAFSAYLANRGEQALGAAYDLGREAVTAKLSVLDLADAHHSALQAALAGDADTLEAAADFLRESLSTFETVHRGYLEVQEVARLEHEYVEQLRALADASVAINSSLTVEAILQLTVDAARAIVDATRATVAILAPDPRHRPLTATSPPLLERRRPAARAALREAHRPRQGARHARDRRPRRARVQRPRRGDPHPARPAHVGGDLQRPALRARAHDRADAAALAAPRRPPARARAAAPPCASARPARGSSSAATSTTSSRPATAPGRR